MEMGRWGGVRGHACLVDHLRAGSERDEGGRMLGVSSLGNCEESRQGAGE